MTLRLMGRKKGMTRLFNEKGESVVCTVIQAEPHVVVQIKNTQKDESNAVQLGTLKVPLSKVKNVTKPQKGHFAKAQVEPRLKLLECRTNDKETFTVGQEIGLEYFADTRYVDVTGTSKGKGFQGVIKRHGFRGGPASHGSSFHRAHGSTGMRSTPGRCLPGVKMAGHMGNESVTVEKLQVMKVDPEKQVIFVKGAIPGSRGGLVTIRKSIKHR